MAEGEGFAHPVTKENLDQFLPILGQPEDDGGSDADAAESSAEGGKGSDTGEDPDETDTGLPDEFFEGEPFPVALGRSPAPGRRRGASRRAAKVREREPGIDERGRELWVRRSIPDGDAQRPASDSTNPHGRITLVQDRYEVDGERINSQTYFRDDVFGSENWETQPDGKQRALVRFEVVIHGTSYGIHELEVIHVPEWEAGQRNFTTEIRWGPLNPIVREEVDVRGDRLTIYGPPPSREEPYSLVIERT